MQIRTERAAGPVLWSAIFLACGCGSNAANRPTADAVAPTDGDSGAPAVADATSDTGETGPGVPADASALFEPIRAAAKLPALGGMMISRDAVLAVGMTGVRKRGEPTLATADDLWHLGSDTKAMTAALIGRLVDRGTVDFDATLGTLFPESSGAIVDPAYRSVTLAMLLSHQSGMGEVTDYPELWDGLGDSPDAVVVERAAWAAAVLALPPPFPSGTFHYSNSNYMVAGAAIERLTGKSWEVLMADEVFTPLAMSSCGFGPPGDARARPVDEPWGHEGQTPIAPGPLADNPPALGPAGTVHCSLQDWGRFISIFLGAHGDFLSATSLARLTTPPPGADYALGWVVALDQPWARGAAFAHQGANTLWFADAWIAPGRDRAFLSVTNLGDEDVAGPATDAAIAAMISTYLPQ